MVTVTPVHCYGRGGGHTRDSMVAFTFTGPVGAILDLYLEQKVAKKTKLFNFSYILPQSRKIPLKIQIVNYLSNSNLHSIIEIMTKTIF